MIIRRDRCLLCRRELTPVEGSDVQEHPEAEDCLVRYTDEWGVSVEVVFDDASEIVDEPQGRRFVPSDDDDPIQIEIFPYVDDILGQFFDQYDLPRLGGASTGKGWSSFSTFEKCDYLWKLKYLDKRKPYIAIESPAIAVGSLVHVYLALHYSGFVNGLPYHGITADEAHAFVTGKCNPLFTEEAWRLFAGYRLYYKFEKVTPLALEHDLKDPRTGESCRFDMIAWIDGEMEGNKAGTWIVEHKTGQRFDHNFLEGWQNDGEVIGQVALWQRLGLDKRFGPLRGTMMNLLGKQKEARFHRTWIAPNSIRTQSHLDDLKRIEGLMNLAKATDSWPRKRANCIHRYGRCDYYDHCAGMDY